jgi:hypothetical protein
MVAASALAVCGPILSILISSRTGSLAASSRFC